MYVCKVVGEDQICLLLQVTVPFWRGHAWRCPHFEPGVGCMCVWNYQEHCFHSSSAFDFFSWLLRLTFDSRKQCQTQMAMCPITQGVYGWFCPGQSFFKGYLQNPTITKKRLITSKASDMRLRCHLTQIRLVLEGSEGHRLVYSNWQHFCKRIAWREPGTRESNGSNLF